MKEYPDNLISEYTLPNWESVAIDDIVKVEGHPWLPFTVYDMVQCGYPLPDHGEMIPRFYGSIDENGAMFPPKGMWCRVEDVLKYINQRENGQSD